MMAVLVADETMQCTVAERGFGLPGGGAQGTKRRKTAPASKEPKTN
jgi:hypothetical protein